MNDNKFLGTAPIGKLLFKLSLPAIAAQLINMLYNLVDRIYIGHIPEIGTTALTGVGVCMPVIMLISAIAAFVAMGAAPRASIYMGRGDNDTAEKILGNSASLLVIFSAVITAVILAFDRPLLMLFGASENTIDYASKYMRIYGLGTVSVMFSLGLNAFITAQGFAKTSMLTVLIGAVSNIILDPILIFGFKLGISGAAVATIISQSISAVWVICFLNGKKTLLRLRKKNLVIDWKTLAPCLMLGLGPFIMQSTESILMVCFNISLLKYGGDIAVGAMTILSSVMQFSMLPLMGLAQGAQPIASYNYGAGNADRLKKTFKILLISSFTYTMVLWLLVMSFPEMFVRIFNSSPELISYTAKVMRIYMLAQGLMGIQTACQMTFISIDNSIASLTVALLRKIVLLIPLIYILPLFAKNKVFAVFTAEPVADFISVTFTSILFFFQFRKALRSMKSGNKKNPA
ncbi:MAG: MATE family efflux transporter [Candidatus Limivicinus sp.]|jgi:putative MATE family efflux protein